MCTTAITTTHHSCLPHHNTRTAQLRRCPRANFAGSTTCSPPGPPNHRTIEIHQPGGPCPECSASAGSTDSGSIRDGPVPPAASTPPLLSLARPYTFLRRPTPAPGRDDATAVSDLSDPESPPRSPPRPPRPYVVPPYVRDMAPQHLVFWSPPWSWSSSPQARAQEVRPAPEQEEQAQQQRPRAAPEGGGSQRRGPGIFDGSDDEHEARTVYHPDEQQYCNSREMEDVQTAIERSAREHAAEQEQLRRARACSIVSLIDDEDATIHAVQELSLRQHHHAQHQTNARLSTLNADTDATKRLSVQEQQEDALKSFQRRRGEDDMEDEVPTTTTTMTTFYTMRCCFRGCGHEVQAGAVKVPLDAMEEPYVCVEEREGSCADCARAEAYWRGRAAAVRGKREVGDPGLAAAKHASSVKEVLEEGPLRDGEEGGSEVAPPAAAVDVHSQPPVRHSSFYPSPSEIGAGFPGFDAHADRDDDISTIMDPAEEVRRAIEAVHLESEPWTRARFAHFGSAGTEIRGV